MPYKAIKDKDLKKAKAFDLYTRGNSIVAIAQRMGVSVGTVRNWRTEGKWFAALHGEDGARLPDKPDIPAAIEAAFYETDKLRSKAVEIVTADMTDDGKASVDDVAKLTHAAVKLAEFARPSAAPGAVNPIIQIAILHTDAPPGVAAKRVAVNPFAPQTPPEAVTDGQPADHPH